MIDMKLFTAKVFVLDKNDVVVATLPFTVTSDSLEGAMTCFFSEIYVLNSVLDLNSYSLDYDFSKILISETINKEYINPINN